MTIKIKTPLEGQMDYQIRDMLRSAAYSIWPRVSGSYGVPTACGNPFGYEFDFYEAGLNSASANVLRAIVDTLTEAVGQFLRQELQSLTITIDDQFVDQVDVEILERAAAYLATKYIERVKS